jgi:hypothetical protein
MMFDPARQHHAGDIRWKYEAEKLGQIAPRRADGRQLPIAGDSKSAASPVLKSRRAKNLIRCEWQRAELRVTVKSISCAAHPVR